MLMGILFFIIGAIISYFIVPYLGLVKKEDIKELNFKDYNKMKVVMLFFAWFLLALLIGGVLTALLVNPAYLSAL